MSRWPTELPAALARTLRRAGRRAPRRTLCLQADGVMSWDAANGGAGSAAARFDDFDRWCAAHPGCDARLFVSSHLLHSLLIDPALQLRDEDAVRAYARQQFAHYHGAAARQWPLAVWADGPQAGACALHALDLGALRATAARSNVRLHSVAPLWSAGLASLGDSLPAGAASGRRAVALVEATLVTWLVADAGRLLSLQQRYLDAPHLDALAALLGRLAAEGEPLAEPPVVVGCGLQAAARCDAPASTLRATVIGSLEGPGPDARWMLNRVGAAA